jgi:hypothetical protein
VLTTLPRCTLVRMQGSSVSLFVWEPARPECAATALRAPWQNGHVERLVGSIRRECLDHIVVVVKSLCTAPSRRTPAISTRSERTARWKRIRRRLVQLSSLNWSSHALCLADFTITMFGFRFSAHTGGPPAVSYCFFSGVLGSTAATPSGLMLKAKNINGSLPGFPHWCTRAYGS